MCVLIVYRYLAYHIYIYIFMFSDANANRQLTDLDIDKILERDSRVLEYVGNTVRGGLSSTFAKASFISSSSGIHLDLDAPDFWQKVGLQSEPVIEEEDLH